MATVAMEMVLYTQAINLVFFLHNNFACNYLDYSDLNIVIISCITNRCN